jgi:homopolymeric O-antigen transport system ATP-binding protein
MNSEVLVRVENVSKKFCRDLKRSLWYGVKDIAGEIVGRNNEKGDLREKEFFALRDISFELRRGEVLGLIGRNGAGKTTLLKILNNLIKPDSGKVTMRGRVGALIALGAGFNPILTGRENIFVNASILGLSKKETYAKFEEIVHFSELEEFIDTPMQSYSSGMQVRLGFAIAVVLIQPDVLLLDEVLAVGDMGFTIKCLNSVRQLMADAAVVFVSHSMQFVSQFCSRIVLLEKGLLKCDTSSIAEGIDRYLSQFPTETAVSGTGGAEIDNIQLHAKDRFWHAEEEAAVLQGEELSVLFDVKILDPECTTARFTVQIVDQWLDPVIFLVPSDCDSDCNSFSRSVSPGLYHVGIECGAIDLNAGKYSLVISVEDENSRIRLLRIQGFGKFRVISNLVHWARIVRTAHIRLEPA